MTTSISPPKGHDAPGLYAVLIALGKLALRKVAWPSPPGRPSRASRCRRARHGHQQWLARHGHLQGQGHGARRQARRPQAPSLCADRRRRAARGADLGIADLGRQCRHGRDHRDRRSQQAAVRLPRQSDERPRRHRGQVRELRLACRALRRARSRCLLARALQACAAHPRRPQVIIADTVKGRGVSFMEHTALESDTDMYRFHSGAPDADSYSRGAQELLDHVNGALGRIGAARLSLETVEPPPRVAARRRRSG